MDWRYRLLERYPWLGWPIIIIGTIGGIIVIWHEHR